jgi:hypothetical protein
MMWAWFCCKSVSIEEVRLGRGHLEGSQTSPSRLRGYVGQAALDRTQETPRYLSWRVQDGKSL